MREDLFKIKHILDRDKMNSIEKLSNIISWEVSESLTKFLSVKNCVSKISLNNCGGYDIVILLKADTIKNL